MEASRFESLMGAANSGNGGFPGASLYQPDPIQGGPPAPYRYGTGCPAPVRRPAHQRGTHATRHQTELQKVRDPYNSHATPHRVIYENQHITQDIGVKRLGQVKVTTWTNHKEKEWQRSDWGSKVYGDSWYNRYRADIEAQIDQEEYERRHWEPEPNQ